MQTILCKKKLPFSFALLGLKRKESGEIWIVPRKLFFTSAFLCSPMEERRRTKRPGTISAALPSYKPPNEALVSAHPTAPMPQQCDTCQQKHFGSKRMY